ncbi:MAG: phosphate/phosphite/phosphonate ABC transporter substrate-binding protein [Acidimicrobiales bacterium]
MTLRATTLLAENTEPLLRGLVADLARVGIDVEFDASLEPQERRAMVDEGGADLVWACGLLTAELIAAGAELTVVGAPIFPGEVEPIYRSVVISHPDRAYSGVATALSGRLAVNEYGSWSGWHGYRLFLSERGLTVDDHPTHVLTGSHRNSTMAVLDGVADVASIDSTLWTYLLEVSPELESLDVIASTGDWPAPPLSVRDFDSALARAIRLVTTVQGADKDRYDFMRHAAKEPDASTGGDT